MKDINKKYKILSPAGSVEQLKAAVHNGCDAVYLGLDCFNARMKAPNFTAENLVEWINFCHFFGVQVYVAINTSIKNEEFSRAVDTLILAYKSNADGVIVTDLALLKIAAQLPKPFDVVASTQLNVHDGYGARFVQQLGASTVVCARECSYSQIAEIAASGINVECFLHGALCVCQSGQCLFSSMVGGNSGNRGLCAQPCRKLYNANVGRFTEGDYLLSATDICSLDTAKTLLESGVTTFKIEGRNRRAEYAGVTANVYSQLFENGFTATEQHRTQLLETYNRGNLPSNNYLLERNDGIIFPDVQNHIGVEVGKVHKGCVVANVELTKGDGLKIFQNGKEVCGAVALKSGVGLIPCEFSDKVSDGMTAHRTSSVALSAEVLNRQHKLDVKMQFCAFANEQATLRLNCGGVTVTVASEFTVPQALTTPTNESELRRQLSKIGNLSYTITDIVCKIDNIFLTKAQINQLRRQAFERLTEAIVLQYNKQFDVRSSINYGAIEQILPQIVPTEAQPCLAVRCSTTQEVQYAKDFAKYIIYKPQFINQTTLSTDSFVYLELPSFADLNYISKLINPAKIGIVCHNVGQVQFARDGGFRYIAGSGLNIFNDNIAKIFEDADTFFYSQELTLREISAFKNQNGLTFVDGDVVLMKLVHCPYKLCLDSTCKNCKAGNNLIYTDEFKNTFRILRRKDSRCTFELVNGKKLSVVAKLQTPGCYCVDFDTEVISHYSNLNKGITDSYVEKLPYTKGRLYNKIN